MTAGKLLRETRLKKKRSLKAVVRETRIKEKFLKALEADDYASLPGLATALGFARNYARVLDLDQDLVRALLRRDFPQAGTKAKEKEMPIVPASFWTPRTTVFVAVAGAVLVLGAYLLRQYLLFVGPPPLEITRITTNEGKVEVSGRTRPAATVEVNGNRVLVSEDGSFSYQGSYPEGGRVEIEAQSRTGKKTTVVKNTSP